MYREDSIRRIGLFATVLLGFAGCQNPMDDDRATAPSTSVELTDGAASAVATDALILLHEYRDDYTDGSGNGNHGSAGGDPSFVDGSIDRAVDLDGAGDFVVAPSDPSLEPERVSVEICFSPDETLDAGDPFVPLVVKLDPDDNFGGLADGYDLSYQDQSDRGGTTGLYFGIADGPARVQVRAEVSLPSGAFHHVIGTYDGSEMRLYLDGELVNFRSHSAPITYRGGPLLVGGPVENLLQVPSGAYSYLEGRVDEVAVYDRALTDAEVVEQSVRCGASAPPPPSTPLIMLHRYAGDATDASGLGNDGLVAGGTFVSGPIDGAISLDGVNDYVTVPYASSLQPHEVSLEVCLQPATTLGAGDLFVPFLVKMDPRDQFGGVVDGYDLTFQDRTAFGSVVGVNFGIGDGGTRTRVQTRVETNLEAGLYHHIVGTYDGTEMLLYLNGSLVDSRVHANPIDYRGGPIQIGGNVRNLIQLPGGEAAFFAGLIEEAAIYAEALTEDEVLTNSVRCIGVASPEDLISDIADQVEALEQVGVLNGGQANALDRKLDSATRFLNKNNSRGAANVLKALVNQVESLVMEGVLTASDAASILEAAEAAIEQLTDEG